METKKIFFLITVILFLLTSSAKANLRGEDVNIADLNDHFILEHSKIASEDDFTNFFLNRNPASFHHDFKAPDPRGPQPGNPGYPHFIVRPGVGGNPPVVPEPVSYLLFIAGGAVLAGHLYFKRKK